MNCLSSAQGNNIHTLKKACLVNKALFLALLFVFFQNNLGFSQKKDTIKVSIRADEESYDASFRKDVQILRGHVILVQGNTIMKCDSAYYNEKEKIFEGFSRVHVNRNDSLDIYGDYLLYSEVNKLAKLRDNIRLVHEKATLYTHFLDYDMNAEIASYFNGGKIVDSINVLESKKAFYYTQSKDAYFKDSVVLNSEKNRMISDTLKYNTESKICDFFGPTKIENDTSFLYCENGWFDTDRNIAQFNQNAYLISDQRKIKGDSLYYDQERGIGKAYSNVSLTDTIDRINITGNFLFHNEKTSETIITDSSLFRRFSDKDTLLLHADTLWSGYDSTKTKRLMKAYHKVQFMNHDIQGRCDSLLYNMSDSCIFLLQEPVLWNGKNQLFAHDITVFLNEEGIDKIDLELSSFIISSVDSIRFNQIKGKKMQGFFRENELYRILVNGNGQTVFYPSDDETLIGVNKAESSNLEILISDGKIVKIKLLNDPSPIMYPLEKISIEEQKLEGFKWLKLFRPGKPKDLFQWHKE